MDFTKTQEKLLRTALPLILSRGYPATTVDSICDKAQVSKGSFYHAFGSKEEMGLCLLKWYHQGGENNIFHGPFNDLEDPEERMFAFLDHVEQLSKEFWGNGCLLASLGLELADTSPRIRAEVAQVFKKLSQRLEVIFEPAANGSAKNGNPSAKHLAEQFLVMLEGSIVLARAHRNWRVVNRGFAHFRSHLENLSG
ncbi:TetR/AcrR family transcriptional regulator [Nitrospina gracilis]|uniref:TetR/AcrR family transcriptional regulator n=1 Tax=Nitrospina gracilis TaxID=35801 RepID=UPI001F1F4127|nr:TetR/AcrR family transcriptional regulator [Nitrospina gracilis]MCF8721787.1 TetR/AcrR family transcriptional repressor of nem operon [Nitrospina gracilis Nb-211]